MKLTIYLLLMGLGGFGSSIATKLDVEKVLTGVWKPDEWAKNQIIMGSGFLESTHDSTITQNFQDDEKSTSIVFKFKGKRRYTTFQESPWKSAWDVLTRGIKNSLDPPKTDQRQKLTVDYLGYQDFASILLKEKSNHRIQVLAHNLVNTPFETIFNSPREPNRLEQIILDAHSCLELCSLGIKERVWALGVLGCLDQIKDNHHSLPACHPLFTKDQISRGELEIFLVKSISILLHENTTKSLF